jgi:hypothetical protein
MQTGGWTWAKLGFVNFSMMLVLALVSSMSWHHQVLVIFSSIMAAICLLMIPIYWLLNKIIDKLEKKEGK